MYSTIKNIVTNINKLLGYIIALFLTVMVVAIFYQVFSRFVVGQATAWSEELARLLMIYVVLFGAAIALRKGELLSVDILPELLKKQGKRKLSIIVNLFSVFFSVILVYYGFILALKVTVQTLPGLKISMFWMYLALPLGGLFMLINAIFNLWSPAQEVEK